MQYVTFDDIQLVPQYSEVESRSKVDLTTRLSKSFELKIPIIGAPMDTVCESEMAIRLVKMGGVGCIHRFMSIDEQIEQTKKIEKFLYRNKEDLQPIWGENKKPIMAAIGATGDYLERAKRLVLEGGVNVLLIDVAHGHHINVKRAIKSLIEFRTELIADNKRGFDIIAGNIATAYAAEDLCSWGADALRCGVGNGAACTTRIETGHGVPTIDALVDIVKVAKKYEIPVIADGGIRIAGDIAKALAVGADTVMLGSLLAGTEESPGKLMEQNNQLYKRYRGSASLETKSTHNQSEKNVEGVSMAVPFKGGVKYIVRRLMDGIRSAFSYSGAHTMEEYHRNARVIQITTAGMVEAKPHGLK